MDDVYNKKKREREVEELSTTPIVGEGGRKMIQISSSLLKLPKQQRVNDNNACSSSHRIVEPGFHFRILKISKDSKKRNLKMSFDWTSLLGNNRLVMRNHISQPVKDLCIVKVVGLYFSAHVRFFLSVRALLRF